MRKVLMKRFSGCNITTSIQAKATLYGDTQAAAIDAGTYEYGFTYSDTRDTSAGYTNQFVGKPTNDIYYKFVLSSPLDITVSHCGSTLTNTYLSILNSSGTVIYSNDNYTGPEQCSSTGNAYIKIDNLSAGTYYVVSEGNSTNGVIRTNITGHRSYAALSTTKGQPHIISYTPTIASSDALSLGENQVRHEIQYYDRFGNPTENIKPGFSPLGGDLYTLQDYDGLNRESNQWLPVLKASMGGIYVHPQLVQDAVKQFTPYGNDPYPYTRPVYDGTPKNEIVAKYGPGEDWHLGNHPVKTTSMINLSPQQANLPITFNVKSVYLVAYIYRITSTGIQNAGAYSTGALHVLCTTDEDNNLSFEFEDKAGRLILSREIASDQVHDTYYVYDDYGNQRYVLPPQAADQLVATGTYPESHTAIQQYAYVYQFDSYNRCIRKKLPGAESVYHIYDAADRLIFSQDGNRRDRGEWLFSIPDALGRIVITGTCKNSFNYATNPLGVSVIKAIWSKTTSVTKGYTVSGIELTAPTVLVANYYDTYEFLGLNAIPDTMSTSSPTRYEAVVDYGERYYGGSRGVQTGSLTACLDNQTTNSEYLYSVLYYDQRGRMIQSKANNHVGGTEKIYTTYDFTGNPVQKKHLHTTSTGGNQTELYSYTYDNMGRLLKTTHQSNSQTPVILVDNQYDELGRLQANKQNGDNKLRTDYAYNLRSWTKSITGELFHQTLYYNNLRNGGTNTPSFSGNISAMDWGVAGENKERGYGFMYDGLSRLTAADYLENGVRNSNYNTSYSYDKQGNMLSLNRRGNINATGFGDIDKLTLSYQGNQLIKVVDTATDPTLSVSISMDFRKGTTQATQYFYDKNGNLVKDLNKGISDIQYNSLNLPGKLIISGSMGAATNTYLYSADGHKLTVSVQWGTSNSKKTEYVRNKVYENGSLKRTLVDGGYIEGGIYYFYLKDHLGNNRVVAKADGTVVQTQHYYPFGMSFADGLNPNKQPYLFGGKELDMDRGVNWYDFSARFKTVDLPPFTTIDPRAEKYYSVSPYVYCSNNPMLYTDPDGKEKLPYHFIPTTNAYHAVMYPDDKAIHIFAHGNNAEMRLEGFMNRNMVSVYDGDGLNRLLSVASETWKNRSKYDQLTIVLHSCNVAEKGDNGTSLAERISASPEFKNHIIIAPNKKFILQDDKGKLVYIGVYGTTGNNPKIDKKDMGLWIVYKNGKIIRTIPGDKMPTTQNYFDDEEEEEDDDEEDDEEEYKPWRWGSN